ncbi:MAG: cytochrome c [Actinomycetia bacterium]|nr:cytochrome c [Actinomycetes bacterium]
MGKTGPGRAARWAVLAVLAATTAGCTWFSAPAPQHLANETKQKTGQNVRRGEQQATSTANQAGEAARRTGEAARNQARSGTGAVKRQATGTPPPSPVAAGATLYQARCQSCHGPNGTGTASAPRLAKPSPVASTFPTEAQLAAFIHHNMPANAPGTLTTTEANQVAAYVWQIAH